MGEILVYSIHPSGFVLIGIGQFISLEYPFPMKCTIDIFCCFVSTENSRLSDTLADVFTNRFGFIFYFSKYVSNRTLTNRKYVYYILGEDDIYSYVHKNKLSQMNDVLLLVGVVREYLPLGRLLYKQMGLLPMMCHNVHNNEIYVPNNVRGSTCF